MRDADGLELPGREPRALEQRPRLVDEHVREQPALPGGAERSHRGAVAARREAARVAVRQRSGARPEQVGGVRRHPPAAIDLLAVECPRTLRRRVVAQLRERPSEVDRGGPRREEGPLREVDVLTPKRCEREAVAGGDTDRGRAPNRHDADRLRDLVRRRARELDLLVGKPALVEEDDPRAVLLQPHDVLGL